MASEPSLRIGDAERDAVAAELREHYAHGRLTLEEFNERLDAAFAAKTQGDLNRLISDLPHVRSGWGPLPSQRTRPGPLLASGAPASGVLAANWQGGQWPTQNWAGQDWTGGTQGGRRSRHGFGTFATLLAAIATWLLVYDVILVGVRFPLPGRLGLLVAIFTVIRGLLRRMFRGARGRRL
jgi:Domain of unknown function (DUF1707)